MQAQALQKGRGHVDVSTHRACCLHTHGRTQMSHRSQMIMSSWRHTVLCQWRRGFNHRADSEHQKHNVWTCYSAAGRARALSSLTGPDIIVVGAVE